MKMASRKREEKRKKERKLKGREDMKLNKSTFKILWEARIELEENRSSAIKNSKFSIC